MPLPLDHEETVWELGDAESQGLEPHLSKTEPRITNKVEGQEAVAISNSRQWTRQVQEPTQFLQKPIFIKD